MKWYLGFWFHKIENCCLTLNLWNVSTSFLCQNLLVLMMIVALLKCLVTSRLGRGAQTKHGLYLQSNMHIFLVLQGNIARGEKKPLSSKFQHPGFLPAAAVLSVDLLNYANIAFDLDRKMNSRLSDYMMCNWKLNSADFCFPLKQ